ncbi:hypothetical protein [Stackebrandtia soli]|uniref:hypothetical protein n=1 Tax=Stackebrandtia soli TaxID=1892856 RepID=UPI0039E893A5
MQLTRRIKSARDRVRATARGVTVLAQTRGALTNAGNGSNLSRSRSESTLRPLHLSLLDGQTLNLCVPLDEVDGPVVLRVGGRRGSIAAWPMSVGRGRADVTALIDPQWFIPGLTEPEYLGFKVMAGSTVYDVLAPPPHHQGGPTLATPPRPDLGMALSLATGYRGRAFVRVAPTPPRAEVTATRATWTTLTVSGRVLGINAQALTTDVVHINHRDSGERHAVPVHYDGDHFTFSIPATILTVAGDGEHVWDFRLPTAGGPLRLGRWISDLRDPKQVLRRPPRYLAAPDGTTVHAQFYFTPAGSLALRTSPLAPSKGVTP